MLRDTGIYWANKMARKRVETAYPIRLPVELVLPDKGNTHPNESTKRQN